jgi:hypothetical protein
VGFLFGLAAAVATTFVTVQLAAAAFANAGSAGTTVGVAVAGLAALGAFLAGSSAYRRARRTHERLGVFTGLAFAFCFALVGGAFAAGLTATYLAGFSAGQATGADDVLTMVAYPVLGLTGLCLGAVCGWVVGLLASGALRVLAPAVR